MAAIARSYTQSQSAAINEVDHNLQFIACAGSGKTEVISARVAKILHQKADDGIGPRNIVASRSLMPKHVEMAEALLWEISLPRSGLEAWESCAAARVPTAIRTSTLSETATSAVIL